MNQNSISIFLNEALPFSIRERLAGMQKSGNGQRNVLVLMLIILCALGDLRGEN